MLRILHLADARLGARHPDLGDAASSHRERQFAALATAVDLAIAEKVELVLVAGDLFATGMASRRTVERAAAEIGRLAVARIRTVILPGHHDPDDRASVYHAYDLAALAGARDGDDLVSVLTRPAPWSTCPPWTSSSGGSSRPGSTDTPNLATLATSSHQHRLRPGASALPTQHRRLQVAGWHGRHRRDRVGLPRAGRCRDPGDRPRGGCGLGRPRPARAGRRRAAGAGRRAAS